MAGFPPWLFLSLPGVLDKAEDASLNGAGHSLQQISWYLQTKINQSENDIFTLYRRNCLNIEIKGGAKHSIFRCKILILKREFTCLEFQVSEQWCIYECQDNCHWPVSLPPLTALPNPPWHNHLSAHSTIQISCFTPFSSPSMAPHYLAGMSSQSLARGIMPLAIWLQINVQTSSLAIPCHSFSFPYFHRN